CASTQSAQQTETPTQPTVAAEPAPEPAPSEAQPEAPQISEELASLRQSIAQNDVEKTELLAHQIIDKDAKSPESIEASLALAQIAMNQNKWDEALLYTNAALEKDPQNLDVLMISSRILHAQNKDNEALDKLNQAIEHHPKSADPKVHKSAILLSFLDVDRALEAAKAAYDLAPNACNVLIAYADALYAHHDFADAISHYEKADASKCALTEQSIQYMAKLYEVHVQDPQKACATYTRLVEIAPDNSYYKASRDYQCSSN
ncbi:MAG: tetratricopeptide repeat protein, partial [Proteobacteria bacterium]|nr:tetratricopeptide repeat protein [Pseudomonadota bacterium]